MPSYSQYEVQHYFTRKFFEALQRTNLKCRLLEGNDILNHIMADPPDFTFCFNSPVQVKDDILLCDWIRVPHIAYLIDPTFHFINSFKSKHLILTCDDQDSATFAKICNFPRALFMPHAVERELAPTPGLKRIYDVVMLATFNDIEMRRKNWPTHYSPFVCQAMEETITATLADESTSFILKFLELLNGASQEAIKGSNIISAFQEIELYIKGRDRIDLINSIQDHEVHLFGNSLDELDWKKYFKNKDNIIVHPSVTYPEAMEVMKQSKIVLNSSIKNKRGGHERIFSGAACGAVVVTNSNPYMQENFVDNEDLLLYRRADFASVNERVHELLSNEPKRLSIAQAGREKVMAHHTWDHRIAELLPQIIPLIEQMKNTTDE